MVKGREGGPVQPLPTELLPSVKFIAFGIFNLTVPDIIAWSMVIVLFLAACGLPLPKIFEPEEKEQGSREK